MAPNLGMLRGTGARAARSTVDTGSGMKRTGSGDRGAHISRGTFINFYDDLGISATPGQAKGIRKDEAAFSENVGKQQGVLNTARGNYDSALGKVQAAEKQLGESSFDAPELNSAVKDSWNQHASSLYNVRVFAGKAGSFRPQGRDEGFNDYWKAQDEWAKQQPDPDTVIATYRMPLEYAKQFEGNRDIWAADQGNGTFDIRGGSVASNNAIKDMVGTAATEYKNSYYSQAGKEIAAQLGIAQSQYNQNYAQSSSQIAEARGQVDKFGAEVNVAQGQLNATKAARQKQWDDLHARYDKRKQTMKDIFGGLNIA